MKSLIFTGRSVRAILDGRKWVTSRLGGLQKINADPEWFTDAEEMENGYWEFSAEMKVCAFIPCPWHVGNQIFVKETWGVAPCYDNLSPSQIPLDSPRHVVYRCDKPDMLYRNITKWRSPMSMPQHFARPELFRTITEITCGRVEDITEEECVAEGCWYQFEWDKDQRTIERQSSIPLFRDFWNSLHATPRAVRVNSEWAKVLKWARARRYARSPQCKDVWLRVAIEEIVGYIKFPV